ncbi:hypothetical protein KPH14_011879 [Odynerus spinipes]|uniref:Uncharacterized protein n=1 Tax=Odynerus spinipes TaxID=1348599 RepID=A0AAD9VJK3_9HYME|nr:hypothetical protein KPH14_011879 [Odynerus spinipes]
MQIQSNLNARVALANEAFYEYFTLINFSIGRSGNNKWLPRSPDLAPLDLYLWRKLKEQVYRERVTTEDDMREHIRRGCFAIDPSKIRRAVLTVSQRCRSCVDAQARHFEHLF